MIRASQRRVFEFHEQPDALVQLIPPWESARIIQPARISEVGSRSIIETRIVGFIPVTWVAEHTAYDPPRYFEDIQLEGPFKSWRHRHIVEPTGSDCTLRDEIEYEPRLGALGRLFAPLFVQKRLQKLFDYRHDITRARCERDGTTETN